MISSRLFRNRWSALFWAGGMVWTAYDVATAQCSTAPASADAVMRDATGEAVDANDLAILANAGD